MTCDHDRSALVAFHLGEADDRDALEARLCACESCLREYLAIKRAMDEGEDAPAPSELARARLRQAVARAIGAAPAPAPRRWHRPVAAVFAAAVLLLSIATMHAITGGDGQAPYAIAHAPDR